VRSLVVPLDEAGELPREGEADLRYRGQSFELTVPLDGDVAEAFHRAHEERYGYADRERQLELVAVRTAHVTPGPMWLGTQSHRGLGTPAHTPLSAMVELEGSTAWIPAGWRGARRDGSLVVTRA
jgi:N-methylhydantoinase A